MANSRRQDTFHTCPTLLPRKRLCDWSDYSSRLFLSSDWFSLLVGVRGRQTDGRTDTSAAHRRSECFESIRRRLLFLLFHTLETGNSSIKYKLTTFTFTLEAFSHIRVTSSNTGSRKDLCQGFLWSQSADRLHHAGEDSGSDASG